jgi:hypothetical protein
MSSIRSANCAKLSPGVAVERNRPSGTPGCVPGSSRRFRRRRRRRLSRARRIARELHAGRDVGDARRRSLDRPAARHRGAAREDCPAPRGRWRTAVGTQRYFRPHGRRHLRSSVPRGDRRYPERPAEGSAGVNGGREALPRRVRARRLGTGSARRRRPRYLRQRRVLPDHSLR